MSNIDSITEKIRTTPPEWPLYRLTEYITYDEVWMEPRLDVRATTMVDDEVKFAVGRKALAFGGMDQTIEDDLKSLRSAAVEELGRIVEEES